MPPTHPGSLTSIQLGPVENYRKSPVENHRVEYHWVMIKYGLFYHKVHENGHGMNARVTNLHPVRSGGIPPEKPGGIPPSGIPGGISLGGVPPGHDQIYLNHK